MRYIYFTKKCEFGRKIRPQNGSTVNALITLGKILVFSAAFYSYYALPTYFHKYFIQSINKSYKNNFI